MGRSRPSVLLVTNEPFPGQQAGRVDGYHELVRSGELERVRHISFQPPAGKTDAEWQREIVESIQEWDPTHVCIWNPSRIPADNGVAALLKQALMGRIVIFWDGDLWGSGKSRSDAMLWWIGRSDAVFSVAGRPQSDDLRKLGGSNLFPTIHTYDHLLFDENQLPPALPEEGSAVFIGSNTTKVVPIPRVTGLPGTFGRWELCLRLRRDLGDDFKLYGPGWRFPWALGALPFGEQVSTIRSSHVLANWDHYPLYADYASDRLAIGLLAGRPQVTTAHPGMEWLPQNIGIIQERTPRSVAETTVAIVRGENPTVFAEALDGHVWAKERLSDREAARHIMSTLDPSISRPPAEPWDQLPALT